ncbi:MAG: CMP-N-acetylneuraminic acid synthetase [Eubacterium sp.]|nr:CMP-N-acetylneuraminic acid synthetase [Eubacterium sp.]
MKTNVLLTGRGNNTLKDKNILDVLDHPVMYYPANACKVARYVDNLYCSSDDDNILRIAKEIGYEPIKRPEELALPTAQHIDCIMHGLEYMKEKNDLPDILVVALANNVTIKSKWVDDCIEIMKKDMEISAVVPVYQDNDHHPLRAKRIDNNGNIQTYEKIEGKVSTNRQDLEPCYFISHNIWVLNVNKLLNDKDGQEPWSFMGNNIKPYIIDESLDIHQKTDLYLAKEWIINNYTD